MDQIASRHSCWADECEVCHTAKHPCVTIIQALVTSVVISIFYCATYEMRRICVSKSTDTVELRYPTRQRQTKARQHLTRISVNWTSLPHEHWHCTYNQLHVLSMATGRSETITRSISSLVHTTQQVSTRHGLLKTCPIGGQRRLRSSTSVLQGVRGVRDYKRSPFVTNTHTHTHTQLLNPGWDDTWCTCSTALFEWYVYWTEYTECNSAKVTFTYFYF